MFIRTVLTVALATTPLLAGAAGSPRLAVEKPGDPARDRVQTRWGHGKHHFAAILDGRIEADEGATRVVGLSPGGHLLLVHDNGEGVVRVAQFLADHRTGPFVFERGIRIAPDSAREWLSDMMGDSLGRIGRAGSVHPWSSETTRPMSNRGGSIQRGLPASTTDGRATVKLASWGDGARRITVFSRGEIAIDDGNVGTITPRGWLIMLDHDADRGINRLLQVFPDRNGSLSRHYSENGTALRDDSATAALMAPFLRQWADRLEGHGNLR